MYYKFHHQLPQGYYIPTDLRNVPSYLWIHDMLMTSFIHWLSPKARKDCYWILRTYDATSFDVAFRLPKGQAGEEQFKHNILDRIEFSNNGLYSPTMTLDLEGLKIIKISDRDFMDILCHTEGRLMSVKEYVDRNGYRYQDYIKLSVDD